MKSFIKLFSSVALLAMFSLTLSSFDSVQPVDDPGNGTIVEVVKGQLWYYTSGCSAVVISDKSTSQIKDGVAHMRTVIFQLPEGHCSIQKKAYKFELSGFTINITPSGKMIAKVIDNN